MDINFIFISLSVLFLFMPIFISMELASYSTIRTVLYLESCDIIRLLVRSLISSSDTFLTIRS